MRTATVASSYDACADAYGEHFWNELAKKPLDRALLGLLVERANGGLVLDVGCGPGHVARALADRGATAAGLDLSPGMIEVARRRSPDLAFHVASMLAMPFADASVAAIAAFYAIVHFEASELPAVFREMARVLAPGGAALVSFHVAGEHEERIHRDELLGAPVDLDFVLFRTDVVVRAMEQAGFAIDARTERAPHAEEHPTTRAYLLASKP